MGQAALQPLDLAEPSFAFGLQDAREEVVADFDKPGTFCRVDDQGGASDTSVFVSTVSAVCAAAVAQGELAALKVSEKPSPFLRSDGAVFIGRPQSPAPGDERSMCLDGISGVDRGVLMRQPLAEAEDIEPDRATRKRLRRLGHEPASVRLIGLRRPKPGPEKGDGSREYHYRWIVRGHWRQQWYPKRQVHRPVWIAPHVKGPEGASMMGGEKVNVWQR
ncbi:hypothetical protein [Streptomyces coeruleorubidus]|uniref:hypothetical protein n=1 Tax=Streptomyces coeruleorubidus TaxID=116188 RepID=UPI0036A4CF75